MRRGSAIPNLICIATLSIVAHSSCRGADRSVDRESRAGEICREGCQEVERYLASHMSKDGPGVAVLVMREDEPILMRGFGKARIADQKSGIASADITPDTVFDLGSVSKQFTAMAILMLIEASQGKGLLNGKYQHLTLQDKLEQFFPDLPRASKITIQHLLTHRSGLPDYLSLKEPDFDTYYCDGELKNTGTWYARMAKETPPYMTNQDVIQLVTKGQPVFEPGQEFCYCNAGYVVLAEIVRHITHKSLAEFLRDEIFERLQMTNTFVFDENSPPFYQHSLCYRGTEGSGKVNYSSIEGDTEFNLIHGDGNVHSTILDMMKWELACNQIQNGKPGALITRKTFFDAFNPLLQMVAKLTSSHDPCVTGGASSATQKGKYGAGFFLYSCQNGDVASFALHHGGEWLGFHSYVMRGEVTFRAANRISMSIVVLSNDHSGYLTSKPCEWAKEGVHVDPCEIASALSEIYWDLKGKPPELNVFKHLCSYSLGCK
jgi:CubicO group peptidase (beta-lactamase class C family)